MVVVSRGRQSAAIGRRLVLDRGRGPGRAESQISFSFSFPFLHSDLLKFTVFREKQSNSLILDSDLLIFDDDDFPVE